MLARQHCEERADDLVNIAAVQFVNDEGSIEIAQQDPRNKGKRCGANRLVSINDVLQTPIRGSGQQCPLFVGEQCGNVAMWRASVIFLVPFEP